MPGKLHDYMSDFYTPFEQNLALAWAQAHLAAHLTANPACSLQEQKKIFSDAIEGGLGLALEFRKNNA